MNVTEIKSETSHTQSIASQFKEAPHNLFIAKDCGSNYGGQESATHTINTMTEILPQIGDLMNKFGNCLETIAKNIEESDKSYGG